jgi:hypothetical protein
MGTKATSSSVVVAEHYPPHSAPLGTGDGNGVSRVGLSENGNRIGDSVESACATFLVYGP